MLPNFQQQMRTTHDLAEGPISEKDMTFLGEWNQRPSKSWLFRSGPTPGYQTIIIHGVLFVLYNFLYLVSLMPASTPAQMNSMLGLLGTILLACSITFSIQFWLMFTSTKSAAARLGRGLAQISTVGLWYWMDRGNTLQSHGSYNLLIFFIMTVPLNLLIAVLYAWSSAASRGSGKQRSSARFWKQLATFVVLSSIFVCLEVRWKRENLETTFHGKKIPCLKAEAQDGLCSSCQWEATTPWFDLLPFRQNFFLVSQVRKSRSTLVANFA